jgi:thiol-disulfide isomerase/thioredoxin
MRIRARWLGEALAVVAIVLAVQWWQKRDAVSGPAPHFEAVLADGRTTTLESWRRNHPGRPVALHFWAEWCPICTAVRGSVDALGRDWPLLTVAMQSGDPAAVSRHLDRLGLRWPTVVDADGRITSLFGLRGVPAFVVLDATGEIRFVEIGYTSELGMRMRLWWVKQTQRSP